MAGAIMDKVWGLFGGVEPEEIDDRTSLKIAREMKEKVEKEKKFDNMDAARKAIKDEIKKSSVAEPEEVDDYVLPRPLRSGDDVLIKGINKNGVVVSVDGENAVVKAGIITTKVKVAELKLVDETKEKVKKQTSVTYSHPTEAVKNEVDVRGLTGDDAYFVIDRYFDSAMMANYKTVSIIHGKGTGALRAAIQEQLRHDKRVASFRSGRYGEGDTGVTVVEFK